ncbi:hypothetical protein K435DRAFT_804673 [Dendrothele bispora CBS 962.96]|uniref:Uncharacterized protein n=1 Tax=Dendrothele bispora (strain CBS 962.96) TaxID=1314807 RepID=A0A4S8LDZ8_DENBC|nr:hypothetical protein K435DRAFT_804673 [Dendrothele bispora CBS 962.96]
MRFVSRLIPATLGPFESVANGQSRHRPSVAISGEDRMLAIDVNIFTSTKVQGKMDWNIPVMLEPMLDFWSLFQQLKGKKSQWTSGICIFTNNQFSSQTLVYSSIVNARVTLAFTLLLAGKG